MYRKLLKRTLVLQVSLHGVPLIIHISRGVSFYQKSITTEEMLEN
jgi:hypothetical protein